MNKGSDVCSSSGCAGERCITFRSGNGKVDMKDASLLCWSRCSFRALKRAGAV